MRCTARSMQAMFAEPEEARILLRMNYVDAVETDKLIWGGISKEAKKT